MDSEAIPIKKGTNDGLFLSAQGVCGSENEHCHFAHILESCKEDSVLEDKPSFPFRLTEVGLQIFNFPSEAPTFLIKPPEHHFVLFSLS